MSTVPQIAFNTIASGIVRPPGYFFGIAQQIADFNGAAPHPRCRASTVEAFGLFTAYLCELRADVLKLLETMACAVATRFATDQVMKAIRARIVR
jgi:hypothetical protein